MNKNTSRDRFRPDIQALRALAVVLVILYHFDLLATYGGYIGVDVFFVISGYLISSLLARELEENGHIDFTAFYARRIKRLLPAAFVVFTVTLAGFSMFLAPLETKMLSSSAIASLTYLSNFWFAHNATDYLGGSADSDPFLHTWSLGVEEQFYLFWPLFLAGIWQLRASRASLSSGVFLVGVVSWLLCLELLDENQPYAFFLSPARAWEFAAGALISMSTLRIRDSYRNAICLAGLTLILVPAWFYSSMTLFPGITTLVPVCGTCAVLIAGAGGDSVPGIWPAIYRSKTVQVLGDASYSWYLWHWPVVVLFVELRYSSTLASVAGATLSLVLALVTLRYVENPLRRSVVLSKRPLRTILLGGSLSLVILGAFGLLRYVAGEDQYLDEQLQYLEAKQDRATIYRDGCMLSYPETQARGCVYGSPDSDTQAVLFGDSHSAHWSPALDKLAAEKNWMLTVFVKAGCPSVSYEPFARNLKRNYRECTQWRNNVFEKIQSMAPEIVFISNSTIYPAYPAVWSGQTVEETEALWEAGFAETIEKLSASSDAVVHIRDTPYPGFNVPECLARADYHGLDATELCSFPVDSPHQFGFSKAQRKSIADTANAYEIDMTREICPEDPCSPRSGGTIMFFDSSHLSATSSLKLSVPLRNKLSSLLGELPGYH